MTAIVIVMSVRIAGFAASNIAARAPAGVLFVYAVPLLTIVVTLAMVFGPRIVLPRLPMPSMARQKPA